MHHKVQNTQSIRQCLLSSSETNPAAHRTQQEHDPKQNKQTKKDKKMIMFPLEGNSLQQQQLRSATTSGNKKT